MRENTPAPTKDLLESFQVEHLVFGWVLVVLVVKFINVAKPDLLIIPTVNSFHFLLFFSVLADALDRVFVEFNKVDVSGAVPVAELFSSLIPRAAGGDI